MKASEPRITTMKYEDYYTSPDRRAAIEEATYEHPYWEEIASLMTRLYDHPETHIDMSVDDGGSVVEVKCAHDAAQVICGVDESHVHLFVGATRTPAWLYIVLGNEAGVAVCDHSGGPASKVIDEIVTAHGDEWEAAQ
jgi:hypothetical protein